MLLHQLDLVVAGPKGGTWLPFFLLNSPYWFPLGQLSVGSSVASNANVNTPIRGVC
jgi:hypothetical protein